MPEAQDGPIVATLTLNPAIDLSFTVDALEPSRKLRCRDVRRDAGGGGVNVARAVRRLGGAALAIATAGGAAGGLLEALLAAEQIRCSLIEIAGETREDVTARVGKRGDEYRFVMPGPRLTLGEIARVLVALDGLQPPPSILVASGSLPPGAPANFYARLAQHVRERGLKLALDTSGPALAESVSSRPWLVKPNLAELEEASGRRLADLPARARACHDLRRRGVEIVALSMGAEGALLVSSAGAWHAAAPALVPISSVGAGDSFMAGLIKALSEGAGEPDALRLAVAAGSAALLSPGTQLCHADDVARLLGVVRVESVADGGAV